MIIPGVTKITARDALAAHARYPDADIILALHFLSSDRRAAGLGALDRRKRNRFERRRPIYRTKEENLMDRSVLYILGVDKPARQEIPRQNLGQLLRVTKAYSRATVTVIWHKPVQLEVCVRVDRWDLEERRDMIAGMLRRARRELMEAQR